MLLERTISQLDIGFIPADQAEEMGHLGYLQWLGALRGKDSYRGEAMRAFERARPFMRSSPAVAVFCDLLLITASDPLAQLDLKLPAKTRRGGAKARRDAL